MARRPEMTTQLLSGASADLRSVDPIVAELIAQDRERHERSLNLLAPSMSTALWLREISGSRLADLDGEGYLPRTYQHPVTFEEYTATRSSSKKYNLCGPEAEYLEILAERRLAECFSRGTGVNVSDVYANIQPVSGSGANIAVLRGLAPRGARILGLGASSGGHLSHGAPAHLSGTDYQVTHLTLGRESADFEYDAFARLAEKVRPQVVILGASSYPRIVDWERVVADLKARDPGVLVVADIAHFAGLVATGHYPNPLPHADVVTSVGYKTFAGPKSGFILCRDPEMDRQIRRALFPGLQSSPRVTDIAAMATAARVVMTRAFHGLIDDSVALAHALVHELSLRAVNVAFGGTDTHMVLIDVGSEARAVAEGLHRVGVLLNPNILPGDRASEPTGLRIGTVGACQRGLGPDAAPEVAELLTAAIDARRGGQPPTSAASMLAGLLERSIPR